MAYIPTQGVRTIYASIGDAFAWLCVAGLIVLVGMAVARAPRGYRLRFYSLLRAGKGC